MYRILILDDDEMQNLLNRLILKTIGITDVIFCTSAEEALKHLSVCKHKNEFPELMLVDLNLTGMSGIGFIQQYERMYRKYSKDLRVIILTNSVFEDEQDEALRFESVADYWGKPLNKKKLLETIQTSPSRHQP